MVKDKTIVVKWSKRENDILYSWGNGIPKPDVNLVHDALDYNFIDKTKDIYHGLLKELEKRGYDMTTFKLTIEPIMDFDLNELVSLIKRIEPEYIFIGADSKNSNLPEPSKDKIIELVGELEKFTKVILKDNLKRILT